MFRKTAVLFFAAAVVLALLDPASGLPAENDQTAVFGLGFGPHRFSGSDDFRAPQSPFVLEIDAAGMSQLYVEWYALGTIGIGARIIHLGVVEEVQTAGPTLKKKVTVQNNLLTLHWVPLGGRSYARVGILVGAGSSNYKASEDAFGFSGSASGSATLAGVYVDWGAEDFGGRFGVHVLETDLDSLNGRRVDASGTALYLDLRWAFE